MMPKLILMDPSIQGYGGHYLSYADSILAHTREFGFNPVLVAHDSFPQEIAISYPVLARFRYTFWDSVAYCRRHPRSTAFPFSIGKEILSAAKWEIYGKRRTLRRQKSFGEVLSSVLQELDTSAQDILFMPTVSSVELEGWQQLAQSNFSKIACTVHLLFRRDAEDFAETNRHIWNVFQKLCGQGGLRFRFYTDTEELSREYEARSGCHFITLPIPHTEGNQIAAKSSYPLTVSYLGDAREEKGYQFLPRLIDFMEKRYPGEDRFCFCLQSNYSVFGGELSVQTAVQEIKKRRDPKVRQIFEPLSETAYRALLENTDMELLLYAPEKYKARSSGIFAEAMAMGIPAIIPGDTWMSHQIIEARNAFFQEMRKQRVPIASQNLTEDLSCPGIQFNAAIKIKSSAALLRVTVPEMGGKPICVLEVIQEGSSGQIFQTHKYELVMGQNRENYISLNLNPDITALRVQFPEEQSRRSGLSAPMVSIDYFAGQIFPTGVVCEVFFSYDEIVSAMEDFVSHYAHYRATAADFAKQWRTFHNPCRLLKILCDPFDW